LYLSFEYQALLLASGLAAPMYRMSTLFCYCGPKTEHSTKLIDFQTTKLMTLCAQFECNTCLTREPAVLGMTAT